MQIEYGFSREQRLRQKGCSAAFLFAVSSVKLESKTSLTSVSVFDYRLWIKEESQGPSGVASIIAAHHIACALVEVAFVGIEELEILACPTLLFFHTLQAAVFKAAFAIRVMAAEFAFGSNEIFDTFSFFLIVGIGDSRGI